MTTCPKGNVLPNHVRDAITAYLKKASRERPVVISSAVRHIKASSHLQIPDEELRMDVASEALNIGLNIHFDGPLE